MMNATISAQEAADKKYTVYKISINHNGKSWFVLRRYNEFTSLVDSLKKSPLYVNLKLPGKKLFGSLDSKFIKQRKEGLNDFVAKLLEAPNILELSEVCRFFGIDRQFFGLVDDNGAGNCVYNDSAENEVNLGSFENKLAKPLDFNFIKTIGKGCFGNVFLARRMTDGAIFGVKVLYKENIIKNNGEHHSMLKRNLLVKNLQHPFLCHLHFSCQTRRKLYFFLDYVNGGELFFHLQRERSFSHKTTQFYAAEIGCALGYLHSENIIYRDLKPENILLNAQGHVVLTYFGLSLENIERKGTTSTFCGTPEYLAPEIIKKEPYDQNVDWWSFGSIIYEMLFGLPPFYNQDVHQMYLNILNSPLLIKPNCPQVIFDIVIKLLRKNPKDRLGCRNDFEEIKAHPFFDQIDWASLMNKQIQSPIVPNVSSNVDIRNIDPEFQRQPISTSIPNSSVVSKTSMSVEDFDETFNDFLFVSPVGNFTSM